MDDKSTEQLNLSRLRARMREKPRTKAGQVRQAWPDIKDLFAAGHSLKDIWTWLNEIGIEIGYARLSHYVGQLRRREAAQMHVGRNARLAEESTAPPACPETGQDKPDPLANILEREQQRPGFNYNSDPDVKKLI